MPLGAQAGTNSLDNLFKAVFGDGAIKAVPDFALILKDNEFQKKEKTGDHYEVPVLLGHEHGFSYGEAGDKDFPLNAPIAGNLQKAQVKGYMIVLRSRLSYEDIFKAAEAGPEAFEGATALTVENMQNSFAKRLELSFLYGQLGIGQVQGQTGSSTTRTYQITAATWAPGIWSGMKDCALDGWSATSATATQRNTNANVVITSTDFSNRKISVSGNATDLDAIVANDHFYFKGARTATTWKECAGLMKIVQNTGSLFSIDAGVFELWKGNSRPVGGAISMLAWLNGVSDACNMGLMERSVGYLATRRWNSLNADQSALREYGAASSTAENGFEGIVYKSVNGQNEIKAHPFMKEGDGLLLPNPKKRIMRVGASDITFRRPGMRDEIFRELADNAGLELRAFCDQAIAIQTPARATYYSGITD